MPSSKVYLTYKRKLSSSINGCCTSLPQGSICNPITAPRKGKVLNDEHKLENSQENPSRFLGYGARGVSGNLHQRDDCCQVYHDQCLDSNKPVHAQDGKILSCHCKQGCSVVPHVQISSRLEIKQEIEGSDLNITTFTSCKSPVECLDGGTPGKDTSGKQGALPLLDISVENKSPDIQVTSSSAMIKDFEEKLVSQLILMNPAKSSDVISSKSAAGRICSSEDDTGSCLLVESKSDAADLLSGDNVTRLHGDSLEQTKSGTTLITFSRRCKRKREGDEADTKSSKSLINKCSKSIDNGPAHKGCSRDSSMDLEVAEEDINHDKRKKDADSLHVLVSSVPDSILVCDKEKIDGSDIICKDGTPIATKFLGESSKFAVAVEEYFPHNCVQKFHNGVNDHCDALAADGESENLKCRARSEVLSFDGGKATIKADHRREGRWSCLDRSVAPHETLQDSTDCMSKSHATVLDKVSPPNLEGMDEKVGESPPVCSAKALTDMSTSVEVGGNSRDDVEASPTFSSEEIALKEKQCLQLFSEQASQHFHSGETERKVSACICLDGRKSLQLGSSSNQTRKTSSSSPLDLGLSLPTVSEMGDCSTKRFSNSSRLWNSDNDIRGFTHHAVSQSSSNLAASVLRHKLMLDSIISRASSLGGASGFQDKSYFTHWSEEELDSLWIGVRRHGRDNWHTILGDPGLLFSSWKTPRDLAERWEKEQAKLLNSTHVAQFKYPTASGVSLDYNGCLLHPESGSWRGNSSDEIKLSLGDAYTRKAGGSSKRRRVNVNNIESDVREYPCGPGSTHSDFHGEVYGKRSFNYLSSRGMPRCDPTPINVPSSLAKSSNLPRWLIEAINTPLPRPTETTLSPVFSSVAHSETIGVLKPSPDVSETHFGLRNRILDEFGGLRSNELQPAGSVHHSNMSLGMRSGITEANVGSSYHVNKPNELIIIDSDASSEETISDDRIGRA